MIWVVDLSASYLDLFTLLQEEMPTETAIMQVSRENSSFAFNPFLLDNPEEEVSEEQFEFCMGFVKLMAGKEIAGNASNELAMREGLKKLFHAYRLLLMDTFEPIPPLDLLAGIIKQQSRDSGLSAAFQLWTEGRRGALFNTGRDSLTRARYCYFDLRDLDDEPELMTAIV
jgi:type IV secretory pathway VirB4 component